MPLSEADLAIKLHRLGASEAAAAAGLDPFCPPLKLWLRKTGKEVNESSWEADWGNAIEWLIADWYSREMKCEVEQGCTVVHPTEDWACCTPDRLVIGNPNLLVQIKNVGMRMAWHWGDAPNNPAESVRIQEQWEMWVTGRNLAHVAACIGGKPPVLYIVERDEEFIDLLVEADRAFWFDCVIGGKQPDVDGSDAWKEYLMRKFPEARGPLVRAPADAEQWALMYQEALGDEREAKAKKALACNSMLEIIGEHEGVFGDWGRATWKSNKAGERTIKFSLKKGEDFSL